MREIEEGRGSKGGRRKEGGGEERKEINDFVDFLSPTCFLGVGIQGHFRAPGTLKTALWACDEPLASRPHLLSWRQLLSLFGPLGGCLGASWGVCWASWGPLGDREKKPFGGLLCALFSK